MEIVKLRACDYDDALDFLDFVFSKAYGPTHFGAMLPLCYRPTDEHMGHNFAVRENGKIRGIVGLFPAQLRVDGEEVSCKRAAGSPDIEWDSFTASRILFGHMPISLVEEIPQTIRQLAESWFPLPLCWLIQNYV